MSSYEPAIKAAIAELYRAAKELKAATDPQTPLPRKKVINGGGIEWPGPDYMDAKLPDWEKIIVGKTARGLTDGGVVEAIIRKTGGQPAKVLAAIEVLEAAVAWCRERKAGRERHAQEIIRQQGRAVEELETRVAWAKLTGGSK